MIPLANIRTRRQALLVGFCVLVCTPRLIVAAEKPTRESAEFARSAAEALSAHLQLTDIAQERSKNAAVRSFAARVAQEFRRADEGLQQISEELKIDLPPAVTSRGAAGTLPGDANTIDRTYTLEAAQALAKADSLFDSAQRSARVDAKLQEFAREHQTVIRDLRKRADELARASAGQPAR